MIHELTLLIEVIVWAFAPVIVVLVVVAPFVLFAFVIWLLVQRPAAREGASQAREAVASDQFPVPIKEKPYDQPLMFLIACVLFLASAGYQVLQGKALFLLPPPINLVNNRGLEVGSFLLGAVGIGFGVKGIRILLRRQRGGGSSTESASN